MTKEEAIKMIENDKRIHHDFLSGKYRQALTMAIEALKRTPNAFPMHECVKPTHECVDLISREDALDILDDFQTDIENGVDSYGEHRDRLLSLSEQLRPTGKWIVNRYDSRGVCCCDNCFEQFAHVPMDGEGVPWNYCPNCGADMRGEQHG